MMAGKYEVLPHCHGNKVQMVDNHRAPRTAVSILHALVSKLVLLAGYVVHMTESG